MTVSLRSNLALKASTLVGRFVYVPSNYMVFSNNETVNALLVLEHDDSEVVIFVENENGDTILCKPLGCFSSGDIPLEFDPLDADEVNLGYGKYLLRAEARSGGRTQMIPTYIMAVVESVKLGEKGQEPVLNLQHKQSVELSKVRIIL
ncbi:MAG: FLgD tudor-like domain-containing protein [Gammaproteobacteria bacterium]|jgi:flagellar hook assembly protein FlgD